LIRALSGMAAVLLVLGVVVAIVGSSGAGSSAAAAEAVSSAAQSALADKTAHIDVSGTVTGDGHTVTITGSGDADFANNDMTLQFQMSAEGQQVSMQETLTGNTIYVSTPDLSTIAPGKSWVSLDLSSLSQARNLNPAMSSGDGTNAGAMLQILSQEGATVTPLGTSTIDGTSVSGYAVSFDQAAMQRRLGNLPDWVQQSASQINFNGLNMKVYVDGSGRLRRMSMDISAKSNGSTVSGTLDLDLSNFGATVNVTAPPSDQVITLEQLLQQEVNSISAS
jgi:hypothetical protein